MTKSIYWSSSDLVLVLYSLVLIYALLALTYEVNMLPAMSCNFNRMLSCGGRRYHTWSYVFDCLLHTYVFDCVLCTNRHMLWHLSQCHKSVSFGMCLQVFVYADYNVKSVVPMRYEKKEWRLLFIIGIGCMVNVFIFRRL